jgi:peptide deformylase
MEILRFPHPSLFVPTRDVTVFGEELPVLLEGMWTAMIKANGMGLAANQVGLNFSMFVMKGPDSRKMFLVNPRISMRSEAPAKIPEGCLSAAGEFFTLLERSSWVQVKFQNEFGKRCSAVLHGVFAVCAQHEIDHLDGISFLQSKSIPRATRKLLAKKYDK